jgi:hypothetical protein
VEKDASLPRCVRPRPLLLAAAAALASACSLLTPIPDLTGGSPDTGAPDASPDVDGAAPPFCKSLTPAPRFCDDFDDEQSLQPRWDDLMVGTGRTVQLDPSVFRSPPRSLLATLTQPVSGCSYASAVKAFKGAFKTTHLAYSAYVADPSEFSTSIISQQGFDGANGVCQILLQIGPQSSQILEQLVTGTNTSHNHAVAFGWTARKWTRFEITYDLAASKIVVTIDGAPALSEATTIASCPYAPGDVSFHVGFHCEDQNALHKVHIDDVTFDAR